MNIHDTYPIDTDAAHICDPFYAYWEQEVWDSTNLQKMKFSELIESMKEGQKVYFDHDRTNQVERDFKEFFLEWYKKKEKDWWVRSTSGKWGQVLWYTLRPQKD